MKDFARGIAAPLTIAGAIAATIAGAPSALAQDTATQGTPVQGMPPGQASTLADERDRASYMLGMTVGRSIGSAGPDIDFAAFRRAIANTFAGEPPLLDRAEVRPLAQALTQRIAVREGRAPAGTEPMPVDRAKVGLLIGHDVGRQLAPIQDEVELPVFLQAVRTVVAGDTPLLDQAQLEAVRAAFSRRLQDRAQALAQAQREQGTAFLARNGEVKGVFSTLSGLQYRVLRAGAGPRPTAHDRVRVNYRGSLLDGTVFDSSYERGQAAEFALDRVIPGWTEGVALMPVGAKYRFWIPSELAYGEKGSGAIPPNSTLVFDVELMEIL